MKFASYRHNDEESYGLATPDGVIALNNRLPFDDLRGLISGNALAEAALHATAPIDHTYREIVLLPPIPNPAHIFCVGTNYMDHLTEVQDAGIDRKKAEHPAIFIRFADTLVGHDQPLVRPKVSTQFDYETELAVIIGKEGRYISAEKALQHVAGYTCFNDGSIRDWQFHTGQITPGKNFFASGSAGPWMVEAADIEDPAALEISLRLNDQTLQHSNTSALIFSIPEIIAYVSSFMKLQPGDIIATGTPAGVGFSRNPQIFMKPGDVCEVEVDGVGILRNPVVEET